MAGTYTTVLGDAFDGIAFKLLGNEKYMKELIEANWKYADVLVFSSGVVLNIPDIVETVEDELPFWRQTDASDDTDEDEFYEYEDEEDEDEDDEDLSDTEADDADSEPEDEGEDDEDE